MSFPRLDFEVALICELTRIGTTSAEAQDYVVGMRRGSALVFATGPVERVEAAIDIMDGNGAVEVEEDSGSEPHLPGVPRENRAPIRDSQVMAGRIRGSVGGASLFVGERGVANLSAAQPTGRAAHTRFRCGADLRKHGDRGDQRLIAENEDTASLLKNVGNWGPRCALALKSMMASDLSAGSSRPRAVFLE